VVDDNIEIDIKESDCRIDTYRASGAGGQHVNTTDSAGAHHAHPDQHCGGQPAGALPDQEQGNRLGRCSSRGLYELELKKREEKANAEAASKTEIGWGHQIRSYVLQPYQLVKDLRTGSQSTDPQRVLDGDIDQFIEAALAQRMAGGGPSRSKTSIRGCGPMART
jgi:peptide chain release factor 2